MTVTVNHAKTNAISDWTQAQLDEQIALGNFPAGTTLANIVLPSDWNDDHTLTGLGTMAEQDANTVAITGGSINGTTIGATTASTGKFTSVTTPSVTATTTDLTLSAISTGNINLNTAGGTQFKAINRASADVFIQAQGGVGGVSRPNLGVGFSGASGAGFNIYNIGSQPIRFQTNGSGVDEQFVISQTASAVNYVQVTGAATGGSVVMSAQGSDTNVPFNYRTKGVFNHNFQTGAGATTFVVNQTGGSANYNETASSSTGLATTFKGLGTDTNISMAFQPKGTGAIDLAAGSSGVNISNGGTVTAITRTNAGANYTSFPNIAISAPTTAGGVTATATVTGMTFYGSNATVVNGGTGYTVGNVLTVVGATGGTLTLTVATVSAGVITSATHTGFGTVSVLPPSPYSVTGGSGSGATFTSVYQVASQAIGTAGSGYIEQPTITFSGGGGSGAAAFASVGTASVIKAIGASTERSLVFQGLNGFNILELDGTSTNTTAESIRIQPSPFGRTNIVAVGGANSQMWLSASGSGYINFCTSGTSLTSQMRVTHTASAVNYVQVTGATTGGLPTISVQGSDTNIPLAINSKGASAVRFAAQNADYPILNGGTGTVSLGVAGTSANIDLTFNSKGTGAVNVNTSGGTQFKVANTATAVNNLEVTGAIATAAPILRAIGSDTNIDLALTPKGTGRVKFGTYTGTILTPTGFVEIVDSGGTVRRLLVG